MTKHLLTLSLAVLLPTAASAQLLPPNEMGVTMGHVHLNVRDLEAHKKFWGMLGGTPLKIDRTDVMKFPGVFVFMTPGRPPVGTPPAQLQVLCGCPSDGFEPGVINHLGFLVQNFDDYMARFKAAGLILKDIPGGGRRQILAFSPDNTALEIAEGKIPTPIGNQHFHIFAPAFLPEYPHRVPAMSMLAWYAEHFGVKLPPGSGQNVLGEVPGANMRFSPTPMPTAPTKGRAVDHIGFEVRDLEAFAKKLEAGGVKLEKPYSKTRHDGFASVELTDPWGISIELTEGLSRY